MPISKTFGCEIEITMLCYPYRLFCSFWIKQILHDVHWIEIKMDSSHEQMNSYFFSPIIRTLIMQLKWNNLFSFTIPDCFAPHHDEIELHKVLSICYKNCNERCRVKYCNCLKIENRPKLELNGVFFFCFVLFCFACPRHSTKAERCQIERPQNGNNQT